MQTYIYYRTMDKDIHAYIVRFHKKFRDEPCVIKY